MPCPPFLSMMPGKQQRRLLASENCDDFGPDVEVMFDKKISAVLNKMMIERFWSKARSTLDAFLVLI
jgi:hypothetical protein